MSRSLKVIVMEHSIVKILKFLLKFLENVGEFILSKKFFSNTRQGDKHRLSKSKL